jgi:cysteine desulfurase
VSTRELKGAGGGTSDHVVYMDYAATTPVDPAVARAMVACLELDGDFGNPASVTHVFGTRAAAHVDRARLQVAALIGAEPDEIVFTSGATESINLAILGVARANAGRGRHIVTSRIEHKAVLDSCRHLQKQGFEVTYLTPSDDGTLEPQKIREAIRDDTILVSLMHANNEIGVMLDLAVVSALCRDRGVLFHTDAAQSAGKVPLEASLADFVSFTAHKIYGPKGIGALYVKRSRRGYIEPTSFGGGHERGLRPGTLPTHQIVGFGEACALINDVQEQEQPRIAELRDRLWEGIRDLGGVHLNGGREQFGTGNGFTARLAGVLNVSFEGVEGESLVTALQQLAISTGSACNSASGDPSYVLRALGRDTELAQSSLRFSLGRFTTEEDVQVAIRAVRDAVGRLRAVAPWSGRPEGELFGEAGGAGRETWVQFGLSVRDGFVKDARFKAYGCPHTLAVASWLNGQLPGRGRGELPPGTPSQWAEDLGVPVEKLGRLLVVEDALRACLRQWP